MGAGAGRGQAPLGGPAVQLEISAFDAEAAKAQREGNGVKGILTGALWGVVVTGVALIGGSQFAERRVIVGAPPEAAATDMPAGLPANPSVDEPGPSRPASEQPSPGVVAVLKAPVETSDTDGDRLMSPLETAPADMPLTDPAPVMPPVTPSENFGAAAPEPATDTPLAVPVDDISPGTPMDDAPPIIAVAPPAGPGPEVPDRGTAPDAPVPTVAEDEVPTMPSPETGPQIAAPVEIRPAVVLAENANSPMPSAPPPAGVIDAPVVALPETPPDFVPPASDVTNAPLRPAAPPTAPIAATDDGELPNVGTPPEAPETDPAPVETAQDSALPVVAPLPDRVDDTPEPAARPAPDDTSTVITNRLPRIGDTPDTTAETANIPDAPEAKDALTRNGLPFDNPEGRPIVAIVLIDSDGPPVDLPFAVSVAVDAVRPDAAGRAAGYQAAGSEVLLIPALPEGARASDVSVAMQSSLQALPMAVAVLEPPEGGALTNREVAGQIVTEIAATGHGLVLFPRGLNTTRQVAARADVPAALVFRQIDDQGQDTRAVKRFLDQAAFRARQEEAVILIGRNRPETIAALTEWALGNRAASVALAPVSAALRALGQ